MENNKLRPMLAAKELCEDTELRKDGLRYPLFGSAKIDGIRFMVVQGQVVSRTLKPIRSRFVQRLLGHKMFDGLDGELVLGDPTAPDVFNRTTSAVMTIGADDPVTAYVFDDYALWSQSFRLRCHSLSVVHRNLSTEQKNHIKVVQQVPLFDWEQVLRFEEEVLKEGYEGIILRDPEKEYKFGRSTFKEGGMLKLKRMADGEARVIGMEELQVNNNEPVIDALGYQRRSSSIEGKVGGGMLGAFVVKDIATGVEFRVGSGLDDSLREEIWRNWESYIGKIVTYKHFPVGAIDKPRHPIFKGFRAVEDLDNV